MSYAGQYYDRESNLFHNGFRDYNPQIGRYVESDPIGLGGGINTYTYVGGNPVSGTDPSGNCPMCAVAAVGATVGGVMAGIDAYSQGGSAAQTAEATIIGALAGATAGFGLGEMGTFAIGAAAGGLGNLAGQSIVNPGNINLGGVATASITGAVSVSAGLIMAMPVANLIGNAAVSGTFAGGTQIAMDLAQPIINSASGNQCH